MFLFRIKVSYFQNSLFYSLSSRQVKCNLFHTLIFPVASLDFLMNSFLHFALQNSSSGRFVKPGAFQYVCSINIIINTTSHHTFAAKL